MLKIGEPIELQYALRCFGIKAGDNLPITPSGVIKTNYIRQWIRLRKLIESESNDNNNNIISDIVECPYLNDVLLRQGGTLKNKHMGNMMFSNLIKINLQKECYNHQTNGELTLQYDIDDRTNIKTRKITNKIIDAIITGDGGGRFLSYSNEYKGWYHMTDREQIYSKVEYICRGSRFEMKKKKMMNSTTKLSASFSSPSNKKNNNTSSSSTVQQKRTTTSAGTSTTTNNMQTVNSSTSMFQFQQYDRSEGGSGICSSKRTKTDFSSINNNNCSDNDNDNDNVRLWSKNFNEVS